MLSLADELFYGGAAGGGKTDLLLGLAVTSHKKSIIFRREFAQVSGATGMIERSRELLDPTDARFNGSEHTWRGIPGRRALEFGGVQRENDKRKYQGRPHDLKAFDEVTEFTESQYRYLKGWNRTTDPDQRCRVVCTGNPPSHHDGEWVLRYWAPWLDDQHPNPALPGELRWFVTIDGKDTEVDGPGAIEHNEESLKPTSRTFLPARVTDNPYLMATEYIRTLQSLPEPLRTQLLYGDFGVGITDDPWQVIPTAWVRLAFDRGEQSGRPETPLSALGVDVARGGDDQTVLAPRYDNWYAELDKYEGSETPDGPAVAALIVSAIEAERAYVGELAALSRDGSAEDKERAGALAMEQFEPLINVDVIGVGASAYDTVNQQDYHVSGVNFAEGSDGRDRSGRLPFRNMRAEGYWGLRESLDPKLGDDLAFPRDNELLADLCAPKWKLTASGILIESKEDIRERLGHSPDCGDAVVLAGMGGVDILIGSA